MTRQSVLTALLVAGLVASTANPVHAAEAKRPRTIPKLIWNHFCKPPFPIRATPWTIPEGELQPIPVDPKKRANLYPLQADGCSVSADVALDCAVRPDGGLKDCLVTSEEPAGWGFGELALRLALAGTAERWSPSPDHPGRVIRVYDFRLLD